MFVCLERGFGPSFFHLIVCISKISYICLQKQTIKDMESFIILHGNEVRTVEAESREEVLSWVGENLDQSKLIRVFAEVANNEITTNH